MDSELTVVAGVSRDKFNMEQFIGSDDIFALVKIGSFYAESERASHIIGANEGMLFRKNTLYSRHIIEPSRMFLFRYAGEAHLFETDHIIFKDIKRIQSTLELLEQLESETLESNFKHKRHLFDDIVLQYISENKIKSPPTNETIKAIITDMKANFCNKKSVAEFAAESGFSYIQFFRKFKDATGLSPSDYLIALRLNKAKDLLINTTLQINEISSACGFDNEYYFSNFFKKQTNLSPSAFRASLF